MSSITLTPKAAEHIKRHLAKRGGGVGLRLGIRLTGCSGMAYHWDFVDEAQPGHELVEQFGVTVFVDPKSLPFLEGTEIDFRREGLSEGFHFSNPNEKASCGCGESFTV